MFDVPQKKTRFLQPALRAHTGEVSESNRHDRLFLVGENPIGDHRSGDRQQCQDGYDRNGLHMVNVAADCGRKRQSSVQFWDIAGK
jgi:hypothetical protein